VVVVVLGQQETTEVQVELQDQEEQEPAPTSQVPYLSTAVVEVVDII
jgi:hypothetical protein